MREGTTVANVDERREPRWWIWLRDFKSQRYSECDVGALDEALITKDPGQARTNIWILQTAFPQDENLAAALECCENALEARWKASLGQVCQDARLLVRTAKEFCDGQCG